MYFSESNYVWQWLSSANGQVDTWTFYTPEVQKILNDAFTNQLDSVKISIGEHEFEIFLCSRCIQKNTQSGFERAIRMLIRQNQSTTYGDSDSDDDSQTSLIAAAAMDTTSHSEDKRKRHLSFCSLWEWRDDYNDWLAYTPAETIALETHFQIYKRAKNLTATSTLKLNNQATSTTYLIDLNKMSQTNTKSQMTRKIQRSVIDLTNVKTEQVTTEVDVKEEANEEDNQKNGSSRNLRKRKIPAAQQVENQKLKRTASTASSGSKKQTGDKPTSADLTASDATVDASNIENKKPNRMPKRAATVKKEPSPPPDAVTIDDDDCVTAKPTSAAKSAARKTKAVAKKQSKKRVKKEESNDDDQDDEDYQNEEDEQDVSDPDQDADYDDDDEVKIKKKGKAVSSKKKSAVSKSSSKKSTKQAASEQQDEEKIKTVNFSGNIPLDEKFTELHTNDYRVYQEQDTIWDCMLNQTNLQNNNNKFYIIQLLQDRKTQNYVVWMRWGRVGLVGQSSSFPCGGNLTKAKDIFEKKFQDKTKNSWSERNEFEKCPGKYDLVQKDYDFDAEAVKTPEASTSSAGVKAELPPSKLDRKVQELIELICNVQEMESLLKELKYDAKKAPLGKLSKNQIKAGYESLQTIEKLIRANNFGRELTEANNVFYTRIPHDFGMRKPPLITTLPQMREKNELLKILEDIEVAVKALNQKSEIENPIDRHYDQLECSLKPIEHDSSVFKLIGEYLSKTHAPTHSDYTLKLLDVFEAEKQNEISKFKDLGNNMLLWHGSRLTNWAGILSQGLRIAPPEAPVTGYMFGKGCYFADSSSKSANYCYTSSNKNVGLMSLCVVSLGQSNELKESDYNAHNLPPGKTSTKGLGKAEPDRKEWVTLDDGTLVPVGKIKNVSDKTDASSYALLYNEYIVYDVSQIKLKYLVKVEFLYDD